MTCTLALLVSICILFFKDRQKSIEKIIEKKKKEKKRFIWTWDPETCARHLPTEVCLGVRRYFQWKSLFSTLVKAYLSCFNLQRINLVKWKENGFKRLTAEEGHSAKIVIRVCASQRGNDSEVPDLERCYTYFFLSWKFQIASSHKTQNNNKKANCCVARSRPLWGNCPVITCLPCIRASRPKQKKTKLSYFEPTSKVKGGLVLDGWMDWWTYVRTTGLCFRNYEN